MKLPTVAESREAERIGAEWGARLREQAALVIVCIDCHAELGTVTWVNGRPLAAMREQGDRLARDRRGPRWRDCSWADRGFLHARIGRQRHVLHPENVLAHLPAPGKPRAKLHVRHTEGDVARPVPRLT